MQKSIRLVTLASLLLTFLLVAPGTVISKVGPKALENCRDLAFSTEEDFVTQGPVPSDGNPIISDGDLLGLARDASGAIHCGLCARNADLLEGTFDVSADLGLDAVDVIDVDAYVVALSTELDSTNNTATYTQFTAGDLLVTNGAIIPNVVLTQLFKVGYDIGLDAVHFVGDPEAIRGFLAGAVQYSRDDWLRSPAMLLEQLEEKGVDIWFSTEGTMGPVLTPSFLDGDLLSARDGGIVVSNENLLPLSVPAGIPQRGVDFGLDAVTSDRSFDRAQIHFSTEILFDGEPSFTDGDVLRIGNGVVVQNYDLTRCLEPKVKELGLDALSVGIPGPPGCTSRITKIGGVDVADISMADGTVLAPTVGINAPVPFGGRIDIQGSICDDVEDFRVVYRLAGTGDPWKGMDVLASKNWRVKVDAFFPPGPDCMGSMNWFSDADGWFDGNDYRHLSLPAFGGCNPGLSLTVWESGGAGDPDGLYEVVLETMVGGGVYSDTMRLVQLDNTVPVVKLDKKPGTCDAFTDANMPLMVKGAMQDAYFYQYQLLITGDSYPTHSYPAVVYYDDPLDNVIDTGTVGYPTPVDLHAVDVHDLDANPVDCGYTVWITAWDRTLWCGFNYPSNWISRCVGCRHAGDAWTFEYTP
jgi:hypothetical protein